MRNAEANIPKVHKQLSANALIVAIRKSFQVIEDPRSEENDISLVDGLMSGFAVFALKDPSLLTFERRKTKEGDNLKAIYGIENIPCDTQMRTRLDVVDPDSLRPAYKEVFRRAQRGKVLEEMVYLDGHYIVSADGTEYFSSDTLHSPSCMERTSRTGQTTYYLQMLGAAIVHPNRKEVIPLPPEPIRKQDGATKNDCERNAARRWLKKFRKDHPHLKVIMVEDGLSPNGPHIMDLQRYQCHFILSCKEDDHVHLFRCLEAARKKGRSNEHSLANPVNPEVRHFFRFTEGLAINESHPDILVNVLEYWETSDKQTKYFCWVTDLLITTANVYQIMRAGRARWKVENETFNTLKNQGYHLEHNYGLGKKYLSAVFVALMMLAFLVDQVQQISCPLFRAAWNKYGTKRELWENIRSVFRFFAVESMEMLYRRILAGQQDLRSVAIDDSS